MIANTEKAMRRLRSVIAGKADATGRTGPAAHRVRPHNLSGIISETKPSALSHAEWRKWSPECGPWRPFFQEWS